MEYKISKENLVKLCSGWVNEGFNVITQGEKGFAVMQADDALSFETNLKPAKASFKSFVYPKSEPLFYYKKSQTDVELVDAKLFNIKNIFLGTKPCDAKSIDIIGKVFNWDYKDDFFNVRAENSVIIGMPCTYNDEFCFCTSVELSPVSTDGSDLFLVPLKSGEFNMKVISEKGKAFFEKYKASFTEGNSSDSDAVINEIKIPEKKFDADKVHQWLNNNFENEFWNTAANTCIGCAQCAFVCPVCHCFDIVDEDYTYSEGRRMKNWDACQADIFTKHASGHNPRDEQAKKYRQRVSHKFKYYKDKFDEYLCTGCGRCTRGCPVSIDIGEIASEISTL